MKHFFLFNELNGEIAEDNTQTVMIVPRGEHPHHKGMQNIDDAVMERIAKTINEIQRDITIDYTHNSFRSENPDYKIAAGWITRGTARVVNNAVEAVVRWTDKAAEFIRKKEYRYLSPVFGFDSVTNGALNITGLINVGLTNNPNIDTMPALANSNENLNEQQETEKMDLPKIAEALGLDPTAQENEIIDAIKAKDDSKSKEELTTLLNDLGATSAEDAKAKIITLTKPPAMSDEDVATMRTQLNELQERETETLINDALTEGKITPVQRDWAQNYAKTNRAGFVKFLENATPVIPTKKAPDGGGEGGEITLTENQIATANQLGVSEDEYKKTLENERK